MFRRFIICLFLFTSIWGCDDDGLGDEPTEFIHSCRLQESRVHFRTFGVLECSFIMVENCYHEYLYNENNVVYKRVRRSNVSELGLEIDSIAFDQMGRIIAEYSYTRSASNPLNTGIVREYLFDNDTDMNPISSELSFYDPNGPYLSIETEEYIFNNGNISKMSLIINGELTRTETYEYNDQGNLELILRENLNINTQSITYSRYSDMKNPIRNFPFRDQLGVSASINMYMEVVVEGSSSYSAGTWESNENGYPVFNWEYDCD